MKLNANAQTVVAKNAAPSGMPVTLTAVLAPRLSPAHVSQYYRMSDLASTPGKPGLFPVSPATLWRWARASKTTGWPPAIRLSSSVTVWKREAIESFIAARSTSAAAETAMSN